MFTQEYMNEKLSHIESTTIPEEWNEIPIDKKFDLLRFYNVSEESLSADDLEILADLYHGVSGSIQWIDCNECMSELCIANPNSWNSFQGVICSSESGMESECCVKTMSGGNEED